MHKHFGDSLRDAVRAKGTPAIVGIDPRPDLLPRSISERFGLAGLAGGRVWANAIEEFCSRVLDIVTPLVAAVKFQSAFFELHGARGIESLHVLLRKARRLGLVTILDAKRGDIGTTSEAYAASVFGPMMDAPLGARNRVADAITVSPYLGKDSLEPFLKYAQRAGCGLFVLVRTSNAGSGDLQQLETLPDQQTVAGHVASWVHEWSRETKGESGYGSVGAVVGGTAGGEIAGLRAQLPGTWLLIPGYGAQGASARDVVRALDEKGLGAIVNSSRAVLYPKVEGDPNEWEGAVENALREMIADIGKHLGS